MRADLLIYGMNYAPEMTGVGRYTGELASEMAARGHVVNVVTTPPHYPGWRVREPYSPWKYVAEDLGGVHVVRCPLSVYKAGQGIWRLVAPMSFALSSTLPFLWRALRSRPRVILCIEPTLCVAPLALLAAWILRARTVLHVQDLEVDAAFAAGHLPARPGLQRLAIMAERWLLHRFGQVVTISGEMALRLEAKGVAPERISVIRNWVDTRRIFPMAGDNTYRTKLGFGDDAFVVMYSGQIGRKQALHLVLEAAERLPESEGFRFVVAGEGPLKRSLVERFGHLPHVCFLDLQPEEQLNELLNLPDCHVLPQDPAVCELVLPSKLGGMLASGRRIVAMASSDSEVGRFLLGIADLIEPGDVDGLVTALHSARAATSYDPRPALEKASKLSPSNAMHEFEVRLVAPHTGATG